MVTCLTSKLFIKDMEVRVLFFFEHRVTFSSRKTIMETQVEFQPNLVFDQEYMETLDSIYAPAFKNLQQEFDEADDFNNSKCLDFSPHPQFDRSGGASKRLPLSFATTLCNVFPIFQRA
eukprot:TRINITY_DN1138_c0_g6_i1.p1 TRINITY_DN1138_c0_g6~~TRINITY_DN1138_c0_g6_i1.p1  ORF type:complete len:119 (-),score=11.55 TRINITY_DN1138_c0_g6_i1:1219-1575(-)